MVKKPKKKQDSKNQRMGLYLSLFIAFIMITSAFGVIFYGFSDPSSAVKYGKYKFKSTPQGYSANINGVQYVFAALPPELNDINISYGTKFTILNGDVVVLTSNPDSTYKEDIAVSQYNLNSVLTGLNKQSINAFTLPNDQLPAISCENSTKETPIIEIQEGNTTQIILDGYCIKMEFDNSFNLRRSVSKLTYLLLGVLDEQ